jgi:zinc protease
VKLVVESCHALPLVQITVAFPSGAAHDPEPLGGLARLTARMRRPRR